MRFRLVYSESHERLYRIENALVTALAHFVVVERRVQLAVYVKARNRRGAIYLHVIEPARRYVVYPSLCAGLAGSFRPLLRCEYRSDV